MRILLLSKYGRLGASSRLRSLQYLPFLEARGLEIMHRPLFSDVYLRRLYATGTRPVIEVFKSYLRRIGDLLGHSRFDLVWLEKELLPWLPEGILAPRPYVVDYDDAVFHTYDAHPRQWVRAVLGQKIDHVMRRAETVIVGNAYLAERATSAGARRVVTIPTAVDVARYDPTARPHSGFTLGWIGTPVTTAFVRAALAEIPETPGTSIHLVGATPFPGRADVRFIDWLEASEAEEIARFDVGIMPLPDTPFERGKCGYKLIQYMACGKPVIASPVGANKSIVTADVGMLVAEGGWARAIAQLRESETTRRSMGSAGRRRVETDYSTRVTAPKLHETLVSAAR